MAAMVLEDEEREKRDKWLADAAEEIERLAKTGKEFTADTIRRLVGDPPTPNLMQAAVRTAAADGAIHRVRTVESKRRARKHGYTGVWRGTFIFQTADS